ncbi:cytochrome P450 [Oryctes borbonicus]|uniref:Cytochrome P450 n=1 Tax=Oryctes borbonicus TaxID=1629725 RepID=A0A0T6B0X5_9SCAR|nr:cytochrome P450 [Oryctes borbonicus]
MLIIPLLCLVIVWYLVLCWKWKKNVFDYMEKLPGPKWYPIFGTTYAFKGVSREEVLYKLLDIIQAHRPLFRSWNGTDAEINIMKPEHLQVIMRSSTHITKGKFYGTLLPWLGEGLFISEGAKWFAQRKLLTAAFHFKILEGFMDIFVGKTQVLIDELEIKSAEGNFFNIAPIIGCATLDMVLHSSMGVPVKAVTDDPQKYIRTSQDLTELAVWRFLRPYLKWDTLFYALPQGKKYRENLKYLHEFSAKVIACRKQQLEDANRNRQEGIQVAKDESFNKKKFLSFLDLILDVSGDPCLMSDADLHALVHTFLFAGSESTGITSSWTLFLLGNNPDIQEKAYEEVVRVLKDKPIPTTLAELNELKYLERVLKESLRLYPVLPFVIRQLTEDVELDGYKIPTGTQAILHIAQVHRDPQQFPDPNKFDPGRFLPENIKKRHPFSYIPFSAGPRNCIGQKFAIHEEKTFLAAIIKKFKITSKETPEEKRLFAHLVLRAQDGVNVKLEKRDDR